MLSSKWCQLAYADTCLRNESSLQLLATQASIPTDSQNQIMKFPQFFTVTQASLSIYI